MQEMRTLVGVLREWSPGAGECARPERPAGPGGAGPPGRGVPPVGVPTIPGAPGAARPGPAQGAARLLDRPAASAWVSRGLPGPARPNRGQRVQGALLGRAAGVHHSRAVHPRRTAASRCGHDSVSTGTNISYFTLGARRPRVFRCFTVGSDIINSLQTASARRPWAGYFKDHLSLSHKLRRKTEPPAQQGVHTSQATNLRASDWVSDRFQVVVVRCGVRGLW